MPSAIAIVVTTPSRAMRRGDPFAGPNAMPSPALSEVILRKGFDARIDSYSAFFENDRVTPTGLAGYLEERDLTRIFFAGLAYDYCVGYSAIDARRLGLPPSPSALVGWLTGCRSAGPHNSSRCSWLH